MENEPEYKQCDQKEHVLTRPGVYVGDIHVSEKCEYIINDETKKFEETFIDYSPALLKIIDEIFSNAIDQYLRPNTNVKYVEIDINVKDNIIIIKNDGTPISIEKHKDTDILIPTLIFGTLLTSSNYNDNEDRKWTGTNGLGAKLTNIFSSEFKVEIYSVKKETYFSQTWKDNMNIVEFPIIKNINKKKNYTKFTFKPDLKRFDMKIIDKNIIKMIEKKVHETAGTNPGLKIIFNNNIILYKSFKNFIKLFLDNDDDVLIKETQKNWEYYVSVKANSSKPISYVNSCYTPQGGNHVNFVMDQIIKKIKPLIKKKIKKEVTNAQIKNNLFLFINCVISNPEYDSQTKVKLTNKIPSDLFNVSDSFIKSLLKTDLISIIEMQNKNKNNKDLKKLSGKKTNKIIGIPKLEDANNAGGKDSINCILILTEGDSAKSLAVSGLNVVGRDRYGVFPLKGKLLNVNDKKIDIIKNNIEINNIVKIIGLEYEKKYNNVDSLRYGKVLLMTDQDQDGSHIKGLLINLFYNLWPSLLKINFIQQLITPIIKVTKRTRVISFYNIEDYKEWENNTSDSKLYNIKYYKGLGTSTSKEAQEYFSNPNNRYDFVYEKNDDNEISKAFDKSKINERKDWLLDAMKKKKTIENPLYSFKSQNLISDIKERNKLSYSSYVNNELINFSITDNHRSLPNIIDGLKISQRKIIYTCINKKKNQQIKLEQLSGLVSAESAYHHGGASLLSAIINLAQNYIGSNNINLLHPGGQFGTRLKGGEDHAAARYIFTNLSPITRYIFREEDDVILNYKIEENQSIEPEFYLPIIPMLLINGCKGIGTGWSSTVPCYNPNEIIQELITMINTGSESTFNFQPWYNNNKGKIEYSKENTYISSGLISIKKENFSILVTEFPIHLWTDTFKKIIDNYLAKKEIIDVKEYSTESHICFLIYFEEEIFNKYNNIENGFYIYLKLTTTLKTTNLVGFDNDSILQIYSNINSIINSYYKIRYDFYKKRKTYLVAKKKLNIIIYKNKAKFISMRCEKTLDIENKLEEDILNLLISTNFDSDPRTDKINDYDYLLSFNFKSLSKQKIQEFLNKKKKEEIELDELEKTSIETIWLRELEDLKIAYQQHLITYALDKFEMPKNIKLKEYKLCNYIINHNQIFIEDDYDISSF